MSYSRAVANLLAEVQYSLVAWRMLRMDCTFGFKDKLLAATLASRMRRKNGKDEVSTTLITGVLRR